MAGLQLSGYHTRVTRFQTAAHPGVAAFDTYTQAQIDAARPLPGSGNNRQMTARLFMRNTSAVANESVRIYFTPDDFAANVNFLTLTPVGVPSGNVIDAPIAVGGKTASTLFMVAENGTPIVEIGWMLKQG